MAALSIASTHWLSGGFMSCDFNTSQIAKEVVAEIDRAILSDDQKYSFDFKHECQEFGLDNLDHLAYALACAIWLKLNR